MDLWIASGQAPLFMFLNCFKVLGPDISYSSFWVEDPYKIVHPQTHHRTTL